MVEEWKVVECCDKYLVSSLGRVKRKGKDCLIKPWLTCFGYPVVALSDGKRIQKRIHRLVAKAFILNPNDKPQVNHIDGVKTNNNVTNLEWNTAKENIDHAVRTGLRDTKGSKHGLSFLKEKDVIDIKMRLVKKEYHRCIAERYNVDESTISNISTGKTWKQIIID